MQGYSAIGRAQFPAHEFHFGMENSARLFLEHNTALHDERDFLHHGDVIDRIPLDRDDVSVLAWLQCSNIVTFRDGGILVVEVPNVTLFPGGSSDPNISPMTPEEAAQAAKDQAEEEREEVELERLLELMDELRHHPID